MNAAELKIAVAEAHRFLQRVEHYESVLKEVMKERAKDDRHYEPPTMAERAAVKRSSLDLSKALAQLRRR